MLPYDKLVIYKGEKVTLRYAMDHCQIGQIIEDIDISYFDRIIEVLKEERNRYFRYAVDDKYGKWRLILLGPRPEDPGPQQGHFYYSDKYPGLPDKVKPMSLQLIRDLYLVIDGHIG